MAVTPAEIVDFWRTAGAPAWFKKRAAFDAEIRRRFEAVHHAAARGELAGWEEDWQGALALLLLLDQFPRNIWRGSAHAFATDPLARAVARRACAVGLHRQAPAELRQFFFLPFAHSEDAADQDHALALWSAHAAETGDSDKWARIHGDIIARFGRFPHRNACLGRETTADEQDFLETGGFAG